MTATINPKEIPVQHSIRPDVGREFLTVKIPNGWDDCKKIKNKVLTFEGKKFTWSGWNSDTDEAYFVCPIGGNAQFATIK